ncbi:MAG: mucoidy inhibitor MuiA family protein [Bacteroidetes bacterium]|nr:MAG: mucoidy inhibitor MuiA family protein [Bacteroidota bacterium]REK05215.1 MAG: mucoidy inhibitor MuiA family protein [Bacteroidota bacterium]REK32620.1 MAG: mucoidy inhibitor MuiA family protein [Bacteroidota bacterium]REK48933.1 MAG: mucoidy inhibitor MuiA family protein [Bacteroidota bacterium]
MKNIILLTLLFLAAELTFAENIKRIKAEVNKATVYLRGVQLSCTSEFTTQSGFSQVIFEEVSPMLDVNSIQANAKGSIVILDVRFQTFYNESQNTDLAARHERVLKAAGDSLVMLNFEIEELNDQVQSLATEKNILLNNRLLKGESQKDTLELFKEAISYLRSRLNNISAESTVLKRKLFYKNDEKKKLEKRIQDLNRISKAGQNGNKESIPSIVVKIYSEAPATAKVTVSFYVDQAAWLPSYDLRATASGNIELHYKAELNQKTGMDWKNIDLTLSTANPALSAEVPKLSPFYINFVRQYRNKITNESKELLSKSSVAGAAREESNSADELYLDAKNLAAYTTEQEGMIRTEFEIKLKYSIPHDESMHVVMIKNKTLSTEYKFTAVPRLDMNAYLLAEVHNMGELNLLPGSSRIYFDGSYIGKSVLNPDAFADTLEMSLGRDRGIHVSRKKLKDKVKEKILADEKILTVSYELNVKNNKNMAISLKLKDQIPVSQDPMVKVELTERDGAELIQETGMLDWNLSLKAQESKKIRFTYEIRMPKSKNIAGL